jgi:hypothetical protein
MGLKNGGLDPLRRQKNQMSKNSKLIRGGSGTIQEEQKNFDEYPYNYIYIKKIKIYLFCLPLLEIFFLPPSLNQNLDPSLYIKT